MLIRGEDTVPETDIRDPIPISCPRKDPSLRTTTFFTRMGIPSKLKEEGHYSLHYGSCSSLVATESLG